MILINGIEVNLTEFYCKKCGNGDPDEVDFKFVTSNKSIQMRCLYCGTFAGNYKYDSRSKEQIRREKIDEWKRERKI